MSKNSKIDKLADEMFGDSPEVGRVMTSSRYDRNSGTGATPSLTGGLPSDLYGPSPANHPLSPFSEGTPNLQAAARRLPFDTYDHQESQQDTSSQGEDVRSPSAAFREVYDELEHEEEADLLEGSEAQLHQDSDFSDAEASEALQDFTDSEDDAHRDEPSFAYEREAENVQGGECEGCEEDDEGAEEGEEEEFPFHYARKPRKKVDKGANSLSSQKDRHQKKVQSSFGGFKCDCKNKGPGDDSCLDTRFTRADFRTIHNIVFGRDDPEEPERRIRDIKQTIHEHLWELRKEKQGDQRRKFHVPVYKINQKPVCKQAFKTVMGGSEYAHREALALTMSGVHPLADKKKRLASKLASSLKQRKNTRTEWATAWWKRHLMWQDWLPNEVKIQYRGPTWEIVYKTFYAAEAFKAKMLLGIRQWREAKKDALEQLHKRFYPNVTDKKLTVTRSARHSKFPECNDCQVKREEYKEVLMSLSSTPEAVKEKHEALVEHARDWQADRERAYDIRQLCSSPDYEAIYQVDDKCGSYWQRLPVSKTGRDTKRNAEAVYRFCVQANVVCGTNGTQRFTIVPKNIHAGSNFGLTNFILTLLHAKRAGRLPDHVRHVYRHTDGGPDNVAVKTHLIQWLLVYLGVFDKITWFRFKAGHSHTETADRLFALMKRWFESDGRHRVTPVQSFVELEQRLKDEFSNTQEGSTLAWDFANWDFEDWMKSLLVVSSKLKGIQSKRVYVYTYDEALWEHGGVRVQYKEKIHWEGTAREAELSPIETVEEDWPTADGEGTERVKVNKSKPGGVRFIVKPPDLRKKPRREPWDLSGLATDTIPKILGRRSEDLDETAKASWRALNEMHEKASNAQAFPNLPQIVSDEDNVYSMTFNGAPQDFVEVMKELMRFKRPLLPRDPFETQPASTWSDAHNASGDREHEERDGPCEQRMAHEPLRDPRRENTITHEDFTPAERARALKGLAEDEFAEETDTRVEHVEVGELYLIELEQPENGVRLGLGKVSKKVHDDEEKWEVLWFIGESWKKKNPTFNPWKQNRVRQKGVYSIEHFRLKVNRSDMTKGGYKERDTKPRFTHSFVLKVQAFARQEGLMEEDSEVASLAEENDAEEDDAEEDEVDDESMTLQQLLDQASKSLVDSSGSSPSEADDDDDNAQPRGPGQARAGRQAEAGPSALQLDKGKQAVRKVLPIRNKKGPMRATSTEERDDDDDDDEDEDEENDWEEGDGEEEDGAWEGPSKPPSKRQRRAAKPATKKKNAKPANQQRQTSKKPSSRQGKQRKNKP